MDSGNSGKDGLQTKSENDRSLSTPPCEPFSYIMSSGQGGAVDGGVYSTVEDSRNKAVGAGGG
jgi:hypothetical protein